MGDVKLFVALSVNVCAWLLSLLIEPACDICSCRLNDGVYFWKMSAFLDKLCEVVDVIEE
jgi:hypothetical protein